MDNTINGNDASTITGIPYPNISWEDVPGQPFGLASRFNLFVFGDANNIVDVEGAMAVGGSFYSPRTLSIGFERENGQIPIDVSPDLVRYLVGDIVSIKGPLGVVGHVVSGGFFKVSPGSTYYIGKSNVTDQVEVLSNLYSAKGGSPYWAPSEKDNYYLISSYDVPRVIPAYRISADLPTFFQNAKKSIESYKTCIENLDMNGTVTSNSYEWILTGNDPKQNIFVLDVRPNGILNKGIRFNVPQGSLAVVRLRTGPHAHLQSGLYGTESMANHILYVFEDATNIHMEKSSDIWGSILAPQAMFHAHPTGGHVSGNAALGEFAVNAESGFEFHFYPFAGGIVCPEQMPSQVSPDIIEKPADTPQPEAPSAVSPEQNSSPTSPEQTPCPAAPPCPAQTPCPAAPPCPEQIPCPTAPPCPEQIPCPTAQPCPTCPEQIPCPTAPPCPTCPEQIPCPTAPPCPTCPEPMPCPTCPEQIPCPSCPDCPKCPECKPEKETKYIPVPIPVPMRAKAPICPACEECLITPGIIAGYVTGCNCKRNHKWVIMLYRIENEKKTLIKCLTICHSDYFQFEVNYNGSYLLKISPAKRNCNSSCKPILEFTNIGVTNFITKA